MIPGPCQRGKKVFPISLKTAGISQIFREQCCSVIILGGAKGIEDAQQTGLPVM
jgi:hypothetical protein